jgi:hypothetical protein
MKLPSHIVGEAFRSVERYFIDCGDDDALTILNGVLTDDAERARIYDRFLRELAPILRDLSYKDLQDCLHTYYCSCIRRKIDLERVPTDAKEAA